MKYDQQNQSYVVQYFHNPFRVEFYEMSFKGDNDLNNCSIEMGHKNEVDQMMVVDEVLKQASKDLNKSSIDPFTEFVKFTQAPYKEF